MNKAIRAEIAAHAKAEFPRECCGLLVRIGDVQRYMPCKNIAEGTNNFVLCPKDYALCARMGEICAVIHSHPDARATPSQADLVSCEASGLPWHIYATPADEWGYCQPSGYEAPLLGRPFVHGIMDCYAAVRDWYRIEKGIFLPDFERKDNWWAKGEDLYVENFKKAGFRRLIDQTPRPGDAFLMQILSKVPNHAAVLLEGDIIFHHLYNRLSSRDVYGGYYRKHTTHHLRHESQET